MYSTAPVDWDTRTFFGGGSYPFTEKQSVYFTSPANWVTGHSLEGHTSLQRSSQCILHPQLTDWTTRTLGAVLPLCREAIGVFYSPTDWAIEHMFGAGLTLLQTSSRCIQQHQSTRTPGHSLGASYPSTEKQLVYITSPADWVTGHSRGDSYLSAEKQLVYSTTPVGWLGNPDARWWGLTPLHLFILVCCNVYFQHF